MADDPPAPRMPRLLRPFPLAAAAVALVAALAGSFMLGRSLAPPQHDMLEQASAPVPVYAAVEERVVSDWPALVGTIAAATTVGVVTQTSASRAVVTSQPHAPGATIEAGGLLGAVAGRPYFALPGPLALYRDIQLGDHGDDVRLLQASLRTVGYDLRTDGTADESLVRAVNDLRARAGYAGDPSVISMEELVSVDTLPATVGSAAPVGSAVDGEHPLVALVVSPQRVEFRADPVAVESVEVGMPMRLSFGGAAARGTLSAIGEFMAAADGQPPGRIVTVTSDDALIAEAAAGTSVTVTPWDQPPAALAVPLLALRQDSEGTYVLRENPAGGADVRVDVAIGSSGDGWVVVTDGALSVGERVLVS